MLFVFAAVLVDSGGPSLVASALIGIAVVLGIEAVTRGRFQTFLLRVMLVIVIGVAGSFLVLALLDNWRNVVVAVLLVIAGLFLVGNLRELRRN